MRISDRDCLPHSRKIPASDHIHCPLVSKAGLIAMQKVVGSNPISRFFANALHVGGLGSAQVAEPKSNPSPHIAVIPGTNTN
jgi:hypothetical protein